jgi:hypothetical protein
MPDSIPHPLFLDYRFNWMTYELCVQSALIFENGHIANLGEPFLKATIITVEEK